MTTIKTIVIPILILIFLFSCGSTSRIEGRWVTTYIKRGKDLASFELNDDRLTVTTADGLIRNSTMLNREKGEFQFTEDDGGVARCSFVRRDERDLTMIVKRSNSVDTLSFLHYSSFEKQNIDAKSFKILLGSALWTDSSYSYQFLDEGILIKNKFPPDESDFTREGYDLYNFDSLLFMKRYEVGGYLFNVRINDEQSIDLWEMRHNVVVRLKKAQIDTSLMETQSKMIAGTWRVSGNPVPPPSYGTIQFRYDPRLPTFDTRGWGTGSWTLDYTGHLIILKNNTRPIPVIVQIKKHLGDSTVFCERGYCFEYVRFSGN